MTCFICQKDFQKGNDEKLTEEINIIDVYKLSPISSVKIAICNNCKNNYGGLILKTYNQHNFFKEDSLPDNELANLKMKLVNYNNIVLVDDVVINTGTMGLERR